MAVTVDTIRKYNVPEGVDTTHIEEYLSKATAERKRRLGTDTYTGTDQDAYDEILIHLTLKRIYKYEDTFFINGIPDNVNDIKTNARFFSREELEGMILAEDTAAEKLISELLKELEESVEGVKQIGGITMIAAGGNPEFKDPIRKS